MRKGLPLLDDLSHISCLFHLVEEWTRYWRKSIISYISNDNFHTFTFFSLIYFSSKFQTYKTYFYPFTWGGILFISIKYQTRRINLNFKGPQEDLRQNYPIIELSYQCILSMRKLTFNRIYCLIIKFYRGINSQLIQYW